MCARMYVCYVCVNSWDMPRERLHFRVREGSGCIHDTQVVGEGRLCCLCT